MISALNVVHKKVQGRLIVVTKPANEVENMGLVSPPDTPFLAFLAASDPVYIPFKTISSTFRSFFELKDATRGQPGQKKFPRIEKPLLCLADFYWLQQQLFQMI